MGSSIAGEDSLVREELLSVFQIRPESFRQAKLKTYCDATPLQLQL